MAYNITLSNGSVLTTISDTTIDNTTSLTLLGKKYPKYGGKVAENFVYLLENFANSTSPVNPLKGQLWYDTTNSLLKLWNGTAWVSLVINTGSTTNNYLQMVEYAGNPNTNVAGVAATLLTPPSLCWDLTNNLLWICVTTGNTALAVWEAVAPLDSPVLTGNPTTPDQLISDNSGRISNTKFVNDFVTNYAAPKVGNSSQTFEVANATLSTEAVALGQIAGLIGNWAPAAGNPLQTFEVADATTSTEAVNLGQLSKFAAYIFNTAPVMASVPIGTIGIYTDNDHEGGWYWNGDHFVQYSGDGSNGSQIAAGLNPIFNFIEFLTQQSIPTIVNVPNFNMSTKYNTSWAWNTPNYTQAGIYAYGDTYELFIADFVNSVILDLPSSTPLIVYAKSLASSNVFNGGGLRLGSISSMLVGFNNIIAWILSNG